MLTFSVATVQVTVWNCKKDTWERIMTCHGQCLSELGVYKYLKSLKKCVHAGVLHLKTKYM